MRGQLRALGIWLRLSCGLRVPLHASRIQRRMTWLTCWGRCASAALQDPAQPRRVRAPAGRRSQRKGPTIPQRRGGGGASSSERWARIQLADAAEGCTCMAHAGRGWEGS